MITQTPWTERRFDFNFPVSMFPNIIERLRGTEPRIQKIIYQLPEEVLVWKDGTKWSIKEHTGHLYDLEELWYGRIEDFLAGKEMLRTADLSNPKTEKANHNSKPVHELIEQFAEARNKLISKVENIDEATASIISLHPRLKKPMRLIDSLFFVAEHDDHHLAKMRELSKK